MIPLFIKDDFIICFEALPEDQDMHNHFVNECGWTEEQYEDIEDFEWFCAKVSAWSEGKELASAYLGACCYKTVEEFYTTFKDDYLADMINTVVEEVKQGGTPCNT